MTTNDDRPRLDPQIALSRLLATIANEAAHCPAFRDRLLDALGVVVEYPGEGEIENVEPHILAARKGEMEFRAIYGALAPAKVKSILTTKSKLATATDVRGESASDIMDMLWERARAKAEERGLI